MADDAQKELFRSVLSYAENTLKSIVLINGGAAVALLAFIGNVLAKGTDRALVSALSLPLAYYVFGVLSAAIATGGAYVTNYSYFHFEPKWGVIWHWTSAFFVAASYVLFGIGSFLCYDVFQKTA